MRKRLLLLLQSLILAGCTSSQEVRYIASGSMQPTLQINDQVLVNKSQKPSRGSIVLLNAPHGFDAVMKSQYSRKLCPFTEIPVIGQLLRSMINNPACDAYIQRVIGVAGDQVMVDAQGKVEINGKRLKEAYVKSYCKPDAHGLGPCKTIDDKVPKGYVLTLGDNRANSWDGRFWPGGSFAPITEIRGVATEIFYPFNRARSLL